MTVLTQTEKKITTPEEITDIEERKIESFVQGKPCSQKINAKTVDSIPSKTQKSSNSPLDKSRNKKNTTNTVIRLLPPEKKRAKISKNNDTKGIKRYPTDKLFCLCQTKNDGKLYVKCETCKAWFHPTRVFPKRDLALTLTKAQWAQCRCVCKRKTVSTSGSKVILCHNTANHFTTQTPANDRLSSPEHNNKTEPSQDKNLIAICCSSSADVNNCSSINNPKNDKSKDYSYSDAELNSTCSQRWKPVGSTGRSG